MSSASLQVKNQNFLGEKQSEADLSAKPSSEFRHYALLPRTNSLICQTWIIKDVHLWIIHLYRPHIKQKCILPMFSNSYMCL